MPYVTDFGCERGEYWSHGFVRTKVVLGWEMKGFSVSDGEGFRLTNQPPKAGRSLRSVSAQDRIRPPPLFVLAFSATGRRHPGKTRVGLLSKEDGPGGSKNRPRAATRSAA